VLASALVHAWWSFAIKRSGDPLVFNVLQGAAPFALALAALPFVELGQLPPALWRILALTGFAHAFYFYWMSRAYEHGDLTLVYPIARSTPALLPLVAVPLLGERISPIGGVGIATVVAGIWLVQLGGPAPRPRGGALRGSAFRSAAAGYAYLTLAATVAYSLLDKLAMAELAAGPWTSPLPRAAVYGLLLFAANSVIFTPLAVSRIGLPALARALRPHLARASVASLVSLFGYGLTLAALETAPVSYVVATRQASVLFALVMGVVWLGERPGGPRVLGAAATVAGVAVIALYG